MYMCSSKIMKNIANRRKSGFINLHKNPLNNYKLKYQIKELRCVGQSTYELIGIIDENSCVHIMLPKYFAQFLSEDLVSEINENEYFFEYNTIDRYTYISPNIIPLGNHAVNSNEMVLIIKDRENTIGEVIQISNFQRNIAMILDRF